ncbi:MAG: NAD(P)/FAD-dependent oxidoreductase [Lachnospiraceae bacterium]
MYDIMIIGAGPAGLSAAIYGVRAGKSVLVLEGKTYGGQIINTPEVENYPGIQKVSGFEFATGLYKQAKELGAEIKMEKVVSVEKKEKGYDLEAAGINADREKTDDLITVTTSKGTYEGRTVILAMGVKKRLLGLPKEQELTGAGISYCATCDGMFYRDKRVAVNGGGNTALEDALFLSNYCKEVYLIHRRDSFRGEQKLVEMLKKKENVIFVLNSVITGLLGEGKLTGIQIKNADGAEKVLMADGLFVAIGQEPETDLVKDLVATDENGFIRADENCKTSAKGIFVAGDCRTKVVRQLTTAAADGAVAALMAAEYLE